MAELFKWGLLPSWADPMAQKPINARLDTAATKPYFRKAWKTGRCQRFFKVLLDTQKFCTFCTICNAVIGGKGHFHAPPNLQFTIYDHRYLLGSSHR